MKSFAFQSFRMVAWIICIGIVLQFAAAGLLLFVGWRAPHFLIGMLLPLASLTLLVLAAIARLDRRTVGLSALLLGLLVAQHLILGFAPIVPWLRVFHILVPVALPLISLSLARNVQPVHEAVTIPPQSGMAKA